MYRAIIITTVRLTLVSGTDDEIDDSMLYFNKNIKDFSECLEDALDKHFFHDKVEYEGIGKILAEASAERYSGKSKTRFAIENF